VITRFAIALNAFLLCIGVIAGCARDSWPDPPPLDQTKYQQEYADFKKQQEETAAFALPIIGAWRLPEGETAFGSDASLPIVLPAKAAGPRTGVFRRHGEAITVDPAPRARLTREDGAAVSSGSRVDQGPPLALGSLRFEVYGVPPDVFVSVRDSDDPGLKDLHVETYPIDPRWRLAARFDPFQKPKAVQIATTRGTVSNAFATGHLIFHRNGVEYRLTALGEPGSDALFVMFKDETNGSTTFSGYRMLSAHAPPKGGWTVLDFNLARNPPCAYSKFTMCPLPPKENRLAVAVEAGVKRHPTARGFGE
jgi:hypothetical protein